MLFSLARDEEDRFDLKGRTRPRAVASLEGVGIALSVTPACAQERKRSVQPGMRMPSVGKSSPKGPAGGDSTANKSTAATVTGNRA